MNTKISVDKSTGIISATPALLVAGTGQEIDIDLTDQGSKLGPTLISGDQVIVTGKLATNLVDGAELFTITLTSADWNPNSQTLRQAVNYWTDPMSTAMGAIVPNTTLALLVDVQFVPATGDPFKSVGVPIVAQRQVSSAGDGTPDAVPSPLEKYLAVYTAQTLNGSQQAQGQSNLGLGTAAPLSVPASGNASTSQVVKGTDTRLSDARTPTAHAASHASGGSDPITIAESQVTNLTTDLAAKAPLASPALSGTPTAPTPTGGDNTTKLATTQFVQSALSSAVAGLLKFQGNQDCSANPNYPAGAVGDTYYVTVAGKIGGGSGKTANVGDAIICKTVNAGGTEASVGTDWFILERAAVNWGEVAGTPTTLSGYGITDAAPKNSPALTGTPTAPTPSNGDNSTKIATTAFVAANAGGGIVRGHGTIQGWTTGPAAAGSPIFVWNTGMPLSGSPPLWSDGNTIAVQLFDETGTLVFQQTFEDDTNNDGVAGGNVAFNVGGASDFPTQLTSLQSAMSGAGCPAFFSFGDDGSGNIAVTFEYGGVTGSTCHMFFVASSGFGSFDQHGTDATGSSGSITTATLLSAVTGKKLKIINIFGQVLVAPVGSWSGALFLRYASSGAIMTMLIGSLGGVGSFNFTPSSIDQTLFEGGATAEDMQIEFAPNSSVDTDMCGGQVQIYVVASVES